jgi:iron complex outermembrane receptor protein
MSSKEGLYSFQGIPSGTYLIEADASTGTLRGSQEVTVHGDEKLDLQLAISGTKTDVLVTASGTSLNGDEIAKALDVVDSEDISLRNELSISEAVRNVPGLRVQTLEGPGSLTEIKIRGLPAYDTSVLIDGMRFRDAASPQGEATAFLETMGIVDTERIEVLRGSGSSLYGSNALGGVINITSRPGGGPLHGTFLTEGGGLGLIRSALTIGGGLGMDRFAYSGGLSHLNVTKGPRNGLPYRNTSTQGSAKYNFTPSISLSGKLWYSNNYLATTESPTFTPAVLANSAPTGEVKAVALPIDQLELFEKKQPFNAGNATFIPNQIDPDQRLLSSFLSGGLTFQHQVSSGGSYHVTYQGVKTSRTANDGPAGPASFEPLKTGPVYNYDGYTRTVQARFDQRAGRYNLLSFGYEFEKESYVSFDGDKYDQSAVGSVKVKQGSNALYFQDQISLAGTRLQLTIGGRAQFFNLQDPTFTGFTSPYTGVSVVAPPTAYTGDAALAYFIQESSTKIRGHVGNSFRAPSGYERFAGFSGFFIGDPRLSPERAFAADGGIDQKLFHSKLTLSSTVFYTKLQENIVYQNVLPSGDPFGRFSGYTNGGGGIARGVELSAHVSPTAKTTLGMSYTYVNSDSQTPTVGTDYFKTLDVSPHTFTATATQWIGRRANVTFDMAAMSDYTLTIYGGDQRRFVFAGPVKGDIVFHYDYPIRDHTADFYVKVENMFNQRPYEDGFIGPKAWAIAGIKMRF